MTGAAQAQNSFAPQEADRARLDAAIARERPAVPPPPGVTGITVPHHLLAADLIARGFWAASEGTYDRIILVAPDHFRLVQGAFATTADLPPTVFGPVQADQGATQRLISQTDLFERHPDIALEHGVSALLPFVAQFFPDTPVVPVVAAVLSTPEEWVAAIDHLRPLVTDQTLIIQSTDYSHFLPIGQAVLRDQETLNALATGDHELVRLLNQPQHMDSRAAQFIQMALQSDLDAGHVVIANRSSIHYGGVPAETTSYLTKAWHRNPAALSRLEYADQSRVFIAGDTLLGRRVAPILDDAQALATVLNSVSAITQDAPLIVNLEGVMVEGVLANAPPEAHLMAAEHALPLLASLGVVAVGLANNHSWDFGASGVDATRAAAAGQGLAVLEHGQIVDLGNLRLVGLNLIPGRDPNLAPAQVEEALCALEARPPLIGFVHWGAEYTDMATEDEHAIADAARRCGVAALIGAHSHRASSGVDLSPSGLPFVFSLGNFLFDQNADRSSGAMVEIRRFDQGTIALRLIPIPHLFSLGLAQRH